MKSEAARMRPGSIYDPATGEWRRDMQPRCSRDAAEMCPAAGEIQPRYSRDIPRDWRARSAGEQSEQRRRRGAGLSRLHLGCISSRDATAAYISARRMKEEAPEAVAAIRPPGGDGGDGPNRYERRATKKMKKANKKKKKRG